MLKNQLINKHLKHIKNILKIKIYFIKYPTEGFLQKNKFHINSASILKILQNKTKQAT